MPSDRTMELRAVAGLAALLLLIALAPAAYANYRVPVPDVRGMTEAQARQVIRAAGLQVGSVELVDPSEVGSGYAAGTVYQQAPPPSSAQLPSSLMRGSSGPGRRLAAGACWPASRPSRRL